MRPVLFVLILEPGAHLINSGIEFLHCFMIRREISISHYRRIVRRLFGSLPARGKAKEKDSVLKRCGVLLKFGRVLQLFH